MELPDPSRRFLLTVITITAIATSCWLLSRRWPQASEPTPTNAKPQSEHVDPKPPKYSKTFRVRGVPLDWDSNKLQHFLEEDDSSSHPLVKSLAIEIGGRSSTATVTFQNLPVRLQTPQTGHSWRIALPKTSHTQPVRVQYLMFDLDFLGITTLYTPALEDHKVDIIAISGLGGHAFGSFKERNGDHMWLRDALPHDLTWETSDCPMARVMIYGYESTVAGSNNMQNLEDLATSFHTSLIELPRGLTTRPIILVAHSLGGLIVKQALISMSRSKNEADTTLVRAVYGIVFFGVPHDGMDISSLIPMVGNGPNRPLIESIDRFNSMVLTIQQRDFHPALGGEGDSEVFCFFETNMSETAQQDENGNWAMRGPQAILVTKSSATHCRSWEDGAEHICAIARNHSNMVKFEPQDPEYYKAFGKIKGLAHRGLTRRHQIQTSNSKCM
ncbi:hypothetical protein BKA56DRAFT_494822 [Ilyonectria sp. MPI-CAGE-AT-0026]|nr:hypothetical protein BKA56DRAFT_494822 [Ilyonectria sp. MPI-CAGE-AT-0026]